MGRMVEPDTFVYVIKCTDPWTPVSEQPHLAYVKVGVSSTPRKRALDLQASMPLFVCHHRLYGPFLRREAHRIEKATHHVIQAAHVRGEWFRTHPDLAAWAVEAVMKLSAGPVSQRDIARLALEFSGRRVGAAAMPLSDAKDEFGRSEPPFGWPMQ